MPQARSLWRQRDFSLLWAGQTVSELGSVVTRTALPIAAVLLLHARPLELGVLAFASSAAILVVGLAAGAWVDRLPRRPVMIAADLGRAAAVGAVALAAAVGALSTPLLVAAAFVAAALGSFFEAAYRSYPPSLVSEDRLLEANAKLASTGAVAELGGPSIGGAFLGIATATFAFVADALSFVVSAVSIALIRTPEPPHPPRARESLWREIATGARFTWDDPVLRALALSSTVAALFGNFYGSLYTLYALDVLGISPVALGIVISAGGVGSLAATALAGPLVRRLGLGAAIAASLVAQTALSVLTPLAGGPPFVAALFLFVPQLFGDMFASVASIGAVTARQSRAPGHLLGRVSATAHVLRNGVAPIGALAGALLAEAYGVRPSVWIATIGSATGLLVLLSSPVPRLLEGRRH